MKILSAKQTSDLDAHTIQTEPITSINLMERAANAYCDYLFGLQIIQHPQPIYIFCGPGNNGGDGLAIARILFQKGFHIQVVICEIGSQKSEDFTINYDRLPSFLHAKAFSVQKGDSFNFPEKEIIIIDAIFGTGLSRPVEGYWGDFIREINRLKALRLAVDIPSGLFADQSSQGNAIIQADYTITFQLPKLAFMFPENAPFVGQWKTVDIGLNTDFIRRSGSSYFFVDQKMVASFFKKREKFGHKGTYGHALLIVGSYGMAGAAVLSGKAVLRSGVGLLDLYVPEKLYEILQISVPEAMVKTDPPPHPKHFSIAFNTHKYEAIGIGCGLGRAEETALAFAEFLDTQTKPLVMDADALNLLAENPTLWDKIPKNSILTPHPGEFKRLFGDSKNDFKRLTLQQEWAKSLGIYILLKGAHSSLVTPEGEVYFNSTGNPGMATAGSGDVLTGIITGLLAQSYSPFESALLGMYLHGSAGDLAAKSLGETSIIAQDVINNLPFAISELFLSKHLKAIEV